MSDRANYCIVNKGALTVWFAAWGGPTVPREMAAGRAGCEKFIRAQEKVRSKAWLDFAFMEGGIALDRDRKSALFFGGPAAINYDPRAQERLLERLRPLWAKDGWTIGWARRYAYDLVAFVGSPLTEIETSFGGPVSLEDLAAPVTYTATLMARRHAGGWDFRPFSARPLAMVSLGPALLSVFEQPAPPAEPMGRYERIQILALLFDEDARSLSIVAPLFGNNAPSLVEQAARENFPGWTVTLDLDLPRVAARLQAHGIDLPPDPDSDPAPEPDTRSDAEIDTLLDEALAYHPEEEIARLEGAAEAMVEGLVAAATAKGQTVKVIRQGGRARVVKPAKAKPGSKAAKAKSGKPGK